MTEPPRPEVIREAEASVVGALLQDPHCLPPGDLAAHHFANPDHGAAMDAIREMVRDGVGVDAVTVADRIGGIHLAALVECQMAAPPPTNAPAYAAIVHAGWQARECRQIAADLANGADARLARKRLEGLTRAHRADRIKPLGDAALQAVVLATRGSQGISTGVSKFDAGTGGLHPGDLTIMAARPRMGKTALGVQLGVHMATQGTPVLIVSAEMSGIQLAQRAMALLDRRVNVASIRTGRGIDHEALRDAAGRLGTLPITIDDRPAPSIEDVETSVREAHQREGARVVILDYLQRVRGTVTEAKRLEIGEIAQRLKALARELDIAVLALAQVSRTIDTRPMNGNEMGRMPGLSDLAESGTLEAEADVVSFLYRPSVYGDYDPGTAYLSVAKNRHGGEGLIKLSWHPRQMRFVDWRPPMASPTAGAA
ncbi:MAG: DnaB-like helicase C-terminal domain-containing protein [Pseudomonadota bacterium]